MKKIKVYKLYDLFSWKRAFAKMFILFAIIFSLIFPNYNYFSDITNSIKSGKISSSQLYKEVKLIPDTSEVIWPVKEVVDLSYKTLNKYGFTYEKFKHTSWGKIPEGMKREFPQHINDYINKYKFITLAKAWNYFSNPEQLNYFTFLRRVVRTIWTASYDWSKIWVRGSGTHAGVDIVSAKGTPIYSIATGIVTEVYFSNKAFGNHIAVLYKVDGKYYLVYYAHLDKILVGVGQIVGQGQQIATMGDSGNSTTNHLHFQINKVFTLQDIISGRVGMGWFHSLEGVRAYTVDPILFVENHLKKSQYQIYHAELDTKSDIQTGKVEQGDNLNLIDALTESLSKKVKTEKVSTGDKIKKENKISKAKIEKVSLSLIDNKVQVGHGFTIKLVVATGSGIISIKPSNANLSYSPDIIQNPTKTTYLINVLALKPGITNLAISDGQSIRNFSVQIYDNQPQLFALAMNASGLNILSTSLVKIYPIDKFGKKINTKINGLLKLYQVDQNGNKVLLKTISANQSEINLYLKAKLIGKGKLELESDKFYTKINIIANIAKDYGYNQKWASDIAYLINQAIVKGDNGYLLPNKKLTRRALLIILGRSVLKVDYKRAKQEMLSYMKNHGKFFKDIDGKAYADPYIFAAWKKGIIKGENGYSLANTYVSKAELLTILMRVFKIKTEVDPTNVWADKLSPSLKAVADTAKKYDLYPFENLTSFDAGKLVSRLIAFETLYRFMFFDSNMVHSSAPVVNQVTTQADLEKTMKQIFDF